MDSEGNPEDAENYTLAEWEWKSARNLKHAISVPMDDRTTADMKGDTYTYCVDGAGRFLILQGVCALCAGGAGYYAGAVL